jgi:hypothetical protein
MFGWEDQIAEDAELPDLAVRIASVLRKRMGPDGVTKPIEQGWLAKKLNRRPRTVQRNLRALEQGGHLETICGRAYGKANR